MTEISVARLGRAAAGASSRAPTVIYIGGSGRSGSTLLEWVLGELPGVVNAGQLIDLFSRTAPDGERCGCGRAFADCPFWHRVGERAFGGWDDDSIAAVRRLQRHVARQAELLSGYGVPITRMRYEDFVHLPRHTIKMALAGPGLSLCPSQSAPIGKGCVVPGRSHGLSGNPSRFRCGVVTLQVDEAWRERMPRRDRFVVTAIGLPLLLRHGWRPLGRSSPRAGDE